ncbi:MAG TPA: hypothetical protein PLF13_14340 [candidate division Zixibacteria bacterium]|nr:hypothetical protein [candidate division Zixibacteria bacterium]
MTRRHTWMVFFFSLVIMLLQVSCGDDDSTDSTSTIPGESWVIRATGTSNYLMDVACSGDHFAAVGQDGTFMTSTNGVLWEQPDSITSTYMYGVEWIEDRFVAVGDSSRIWISTDGTTWTVPDSIEEDEDWMYGIGGNSEIMLAVGESGLILHSTDQGQNWFLPDSTVDELATSANLHAVTWSEEEELFVAVGGSGTIITSADGRVWTLAASSLDAWLYDVTWSPDFGLFVAVGQDGHIITSPDGKIWTLRESRLGAYLFDVACSDTRIVAVGLNGLVLSSEDGITWTLRGSDYTQHLRGVVWSSSDQLFVAVGLGQGVRTSSDGITWTTQFDGLDIDLYGVTYLPNDDTLCLAAGSHGTILASYGGLNWRLAFSGLEYTLYDIAHLGTDKIVAVGDQGAVLSSTDGGQSWTASQPTINTFLGVTAAGNSFVAVGRYGTIFTTEDMVNWHQETSIVEQEHLNAVTSHGDQVIAVGEQGAMLEASTTDLSSWSEIDFPIDTLDLYGIAWIDSMYIVVGANGSIYTSPDGATWTEQLWDVDDTDDLVQLNGVAASNKRFVTVGVGLNIVISSDGETYTRQVYYDSGSLEDVTWTGGRFVAVGWGNAIFTSP